MNRINTALASGLLLFLVAPVYAQQQDQGSRPDAATQQEEPRREPQAAPRQEPPETAPPQQERKQEPQAKPEKQEKQEAPRESKEQPREEHGQSAQKGQTRANGKGGHIPEAKFKADFGRQHRFVVNRVITTTTIVPNQTQFIYSGVTFVFLDPWPAGWAFTDDCYIDFVDDQYFLFDPLHPGIQVALLVVE